MSVLRSSAKDVEAGPRELRQRGAARVQALTVGRPSELFTGSACGMCRRAGSVWEFHDALFASRNLSPVLFEEIAGGLGLGMEKFRACLNSEQSHNAIVKDSEAARLFRIDSTPSFIVNIEARLALPSFRKSSSASWANAPVKHNPQSNRDPHMNRIYLALTSLLLFVITGFAQDRSLEKIVRETYRKLEHYNAAAQLFQNEYTRKPFRSDANLSFELSDFRSGDVRDILHKRYADLVTLPTGDVVSLTRGGHSVDGGAQEATFAAAWERALCICL